MLLTWTYFGDLARSPGDDVHVDHGVDEEEQEAGRNAQEVEHARYETHELLRMEQARQDEDTWEIKKYLLLYSYRRCVDDVIIPHQGHGRHYMVISSHLLKLFLIIQDLQFLVFI